MLLDVWERYRGVSVIIFESFVAISCENPAFAVVNVTRRLRALQGSLCHYFWIFSCYFLWKSSICCLSMFLDVWECYRICCLSMLLDVWERYRGVSVIIFESFVAISCENQQHLLFVNVPRRLRALKLSLYHYFRVFRYCFSWKSSICCL